jgi:hypothetical protein
MSKGVGSAAFKLVESEVMSTFSIVSNSLFEKVASRLIIKRIETIPPKRDLY